MYYVHSYVHNGDHSLIGAQKKKQNKKKQNKMLLDVEHFSAQEKNKIRNTQSGEWCGG